MKINMNKYGKYELNYILRTFNNIVRGGDIQRRPGVRGDMESFGLSYEDAQDTDQ